MKKTIFIFLGLFFMSLTKDTNEDEQIKLKELAKLISSMGYGQGLQKLLSKSDVKNKTVSEQSETDTEDTSDEESEEVLKNPLSFSKEVKSEEEKKEESKQETNEIPEEPPKTQKHKKKKNKEKQEDKQENKQEDNLEEINSIDFDQLKDDDLEELQGLNEPPKKIKQEPSLEEIQEQSEEEIEPIVDEHYDTEIQSRHEKCQNDPDYEKCMKKQLNKKFDKLIETLSNLKTSLKIICKNNLKYCQRIFEELDSFQEFRPDSDSELIKQAKETAILNAKKISDIAINELQISSSEVKDILIAKSQEAAMNKALEIVNSSPNAITNEEILSNVSKETEKVSQEAIKDYFENMNKATSKKLSKIDAVKLLATLFNQIHSIILFSKINPFRIYSISLNFLIQQFFQIFTLKSSSLNSILKLFVFFLKNCRCIFFFV